MRESQGRQHSHGVFLDIAWIKTGFQTAPSTSEKAAEHMPPVQAAGRSRHHRGADGNQPDDTTSGAPGGRGHPDVGRSAACLPQASVRRHQRRQSSRRQLARHHRVRQTRRRARRSSRTGRRATRSTRAGGRGGPRALEPFDRGQRPGSYQVQYALRDDAGPGGSPGTPRCSASTD